MTEQKLMPFGKFKGCPVRDVDAAYLRWCLRECHTLDADMRAAIEDELARRGAVGNTQAGHDRERGDAPTGNDRAALFDLLSDLIAAGARIVAKGDGAIHLFAASALTPDLRSRLRRLHADIDALARWVLYESPGRYRTTPAATLLARLRSRGVPVVALPGGSVVSSDFETGEDALAELSAAARREAWLRVAANLPDPDVANGSNGSHVPTPPNALAGLHAHVAKRAARGTGKWAGKWRTYAETVAAARAWQVAPVLVIEDLVAHCRLEAERARRRNSDAAALRWRGWTEALVARCR
jgi:hypothetical protein